MMSRNIFLGFVVLISTWSTAAAEPAVDVEAWGYKPRYARAVVPPPPKRGAYPVGQRLVYTIWIDNDDPYDGMRDVVIKMDRLPAHIRLDLSETQPAYGNIFYDSGLPQYPDTPAASRLYYISNPGGETRVLNPGTSPDSVADVLWVLRRGNFGEVIGPHNANEDINSGDDADTRYGVVPDSDVAYVRYSATVISKPKKSRLKK